MQEKRLQSSVAMDWGMLAEGLPQGPPLDAVVAVDADEARVVARGAVERVSASETVAVARPFWRVPTQTE